MKPVNIGKLDRRVVIQSESITYDSDTNEQVKTFSTLATVWARRLNNGSAEKYEADQQVSLRTVRYLLRYDNRVTETMRLVDGSQTFEISGIEQIDRKTTMVLTAQLRDNE